MRSGPAGSAGRLKAALRDVVPEPQRRKVLGAIRPAMYRGSDVVCPCCKGSFGRFMTHRGHANVRCPRCGSMERHRLLWLYVRAHEDVVLQGRRRVLHMAPEPPLRPLFADRPGVEYVTADLDSPFADVHCDIQALPFGDDDFDLIICNHVLEHIPDDARAMAELARVLRPGGLAVLMCPVARDLATTLEDPTVRTEEDRMRVYGQHDHVRLYGADYVDRLRSAGFRAEVVPALDTIDEATKRRHALVRSHDLFEPDDVYLGRV